MKRRFARFTLLALCLFGLHASPAAATFHLMQVREVYAGSAANPASQYVELQMWRSGQDFVAGHLLRSYDAGGGVIATSTFPANVPNGANQSTLVLATPEAEAEFGIAADAALAGQFSPAGGAVCWETIDCVAWGSFGGSTLPSPAGSPVAVGGIPAGMALRRSIARGCATTLDAEDDHDDSAADFEIVFPAPRPNSIAPSEQPCAGAGGGGSGSPSSGEDKPQTTLRRKPLKRSTDRTPTFRFTSNAHDARFECKLDGKRYRPCRSPFTAGRLALGPHRFRVRAVDHGLKDPTPASYRFTVIRQAK